MTTNNNDTITFPARLSALASVASKDGGRYAMDHVELRAVDRNVSVVATDGVRALVAVTEGADEHVTCPIVKLCPAKTLRAIKPTAAPLASINGRLEHANTSHALPEADDVGEFPPVADVIGIPESAPAPVGIWINAALLRDTLDAIIKASADDLKRGELVVELVLRGDKVAMRIEARAGETSYTALVMPVQSMGRCVGDNASPAADKYAEMCAVRRA